MEMDEVKKFNSAVTIAKASWGSSIIAIIYLNILLHSEIAKQHGLIFGFLTLIGAIFFLTGFTCGCISLYRGKRFHWSKVFWHGVAGSLISLVFVIIMGLGAVTGFRNVTKRGEELKRLQSEISNHPKYKKLIANKSPEALANLSRTLVLRGLRRMDDPSLSQRAAFLEQWANQEDETICAGIFTGHLEASVVLDLVKQLSPAQEKEWYIIAQKAILLELNEAPLTPVSQDEMIKAFGELYSDMKPEEVERLKKNFIEITKKRFPTNSESCWSIRVIFKHLHNISPQARMALTRAIAIGG